MSLATPNLPFFHRIFRLSRKHSSSPSPPSSKWTSNLPPVSLSKTSDPACLSAKDTNRSDKTTPATFRSKGTTAKWSRPGGCGSCDFTSKATRGVGANGNFIWVGFFVHSHSLLTELKTFFFLIVFQVIESWG